MDRDGGPGRVQDANSAWQGNSESSPGCSIGPSLKRVE